MTWLRFTLTGLFFALVVEVYYKFFAALKPNGFFISIIFYIVCLQLLYLLHKGLNHFVKNKKLGHSLFFIISGMFGLFVLEWGLVGNTPSGNPKASQIGMFVFHAVWPFMARLFVDRSDEAQALQKKLMEFFAVFLVVCTLGIVIQNTDIRKLWFIFVPLYAYYGLCYFIWRYIFKIERKAEQVQNDPS